MGTVRDAETALPIASALVEIPGQGIDETNAAGEFVLSATTGEHELFVEATGYEASGAIPVTVLAGQPVEIDDVLLEPIFIEPGPRVWIVNASTETVTDVTLVGEDEDEVFLDTVGAGIVRSAELKTGVRLASELAFSARDSGDDELSWSGIAEPEMWFLVTTSEVGPGLDVRQLSVEEAKAWSGSESFR